MTPVNFLRNELEKISKEFSQIHIKYAYNNLIYTHVVELLPLSEYQNNDELDNTWIPLSFYFREKYPKEEITFVSSDSTLSIQHPEFELNIPSLDDLMIAKVFKPFSEKEYDYTFPTCIPNRTEVVGGYVGDLLRYPSKKLLGYETDLDTTYYQAAA